MKTLNWLQSIVMGFVHWTCMPKCHTHRTQIFSPTCERKTINWMQSIVLWFANWTWMPKCCTVPQEIVHERIIEIFKISVTAKSPVWQQLVFVRRKLKRKKFPYCLKRYLKTPSTIQNGRWTFLLPGRIWEWTKKRSWKHLEATGLSRAMSRTCQSHSSTCSPTV